MWLPLHVHAHSVEMMQSIRIVRNLTHRYEAAGRMEYGRGRSGSNLT